MKPSLQPINTNIQNRFDDTVLTAEDFMDFEEFLDMLPSNYRDQTNSLVNGTANTSPQAFKLCFGYVAI